MLGLGSHSVVFVYCTAAKAFGRLFGSDGRDECEKLNGIPVSLALFVMNLCLVRM